MHKNKQKRQFLIVLLKSNLPASIKTKVKLIIDEIFSTNYFKKNHGVSTTPEFEKFIILIKKATQSPFWKIEPRRLKNSFIPLENSIDELNNKIDLYRKISNNNEFQLINIVCLYQMIAMDKIVTQSSFIKYLDDQKKKDSFSESFVFIINLLIIDGNFPIALKYLKHYKSNKILSFDFDQIFFFTQLLAICDQKIPINLFNYYLEKINFKIFNNKSLIALASEELLDEVKIEFDKKLNIKNLNNIIKSTIKSRKKINRDNVFYKSIYKMCEITGTGNIFLETLIFKAYSRYNIKDHIFSFGNFNIIYNSMDQLVDLYRLCVNKVRQKNGLPKIGEGWISETKLYYKLKDYFSSYNIQQHGKPKWLGRQHLDIYFPELNIGIEYQGEQHFKPIEFFGGEKGLKHRKELDKKKKRLCKENNCKLIYVYPDYEPELLFEDLHKLINKITFELP